MWWGIWVVPGAGEKVGGGATTRIALRLVIISEDPLHGGVRRS